MISEKNYRVDLSHAELVFAIEALHDALVEQITNATVDNYGTWRENIDLDMFKLVTNGTVTLYGRLLQVYQENDLDKQLEAWVEQVQFIPEHWNILNNIYEAKSWDDITILTQEEFDDL